MRLRARISRLYWELRGRVVVVDLVYEHDAGLAVEPGPLDDLPEQVPGANSLHDLAVARVGEFEIGIGLDGLHELIGYGDRDVEVVDLVVVLLAGDELLYVGVIHPEDTHVRPAPGPALFDLVRRSVVYRHERDGPGRDAHRALDQVILRTQTREAEASAAAALVNYRLVLEGVVDAVYGVLDGQHEARAELLQLPARVHEGRRVRHEPPAEHHLEEPLPRLLVELLGLLTLFEAELALGDVRSDPQEHLDGLLYRLALLVLLEIALPQNGTRVLGEFYICQPVTVNLHTHPPYSTARRSFSITGFARIASNCGPGLYLPLPIPEPARRTSSVRNWSTSVYCLYTEANRRYATMSILLSRKSTMSPRRLEVTSCRRRSTSTTSISSTISSICSSVTCCLAQAFANPDLNFFRSKGSFPPSRLITISLNGSRRS